MRVEACAVGPVDELDVVRVVVEAFIRQRLHTRRHVQRRHLVGAGGETDEGIDGSALGLGLVLVEIQRSRHPIGRVDDSIQSDDLRQADECTVDRLRGLDLQRGEPGALRADLERGLPGDVERASRRSVDEVVLLCARLDGGRQDEQLDARPGLTWRQRHVDFTFVRYEAAASDHRTHGTRRRVERHDRCIEAFGGVGQLVAGLLGQGLQVCVEGGVDPQTATEQLVVALLVGVAEDLGPVEQVVPQCLGEVRPRERTIGQGLDPRRQHELLGEAFGLDLGDRLLVDEPVEYLEPTGAAALGFVDRVETRRRTHQAGKEGRLDEGEVRRLLAEVRLGGSLDAVGVVAEEDGVEIAGHDVLFRHLVLEHAGIVHLQELVAAVAFQPGEEVVLGDLHRDRRGALLG